VNSSLDKHFAARLATAEAQLFARHFGLANLLIAFFCDALVKAGPVASEVKCALLLWHGAVLAAFAFEFLHQRVWQASPILTRVAACTGVLLHTAIFYEDLLETGVLSSAVLRTQTSDWLRTAALECSLERRVMMGATSAASFAVIYEPLGRVLLRGQKSINDGHGRTSVPRNYWTVVLGSLLQIAMWIAASTRVLPTFKHVSFRADEASALNTVPAILLCMLIAEFGFYWSHRLFHCRLLYRHFHCLHHRIAAPVSAYDALYQDPVELELNLLLTYLPLAFVPIHIGAIACYLYFSGFVAFVLNHSGREYELTIPIPFTEPACQYVVWSTKLHDDHHHFAKGNFGAQLWCFDEIFGTRIRASKPKTRTKRRWDALAHAAQAVALWKATTAGV